MTSFSFACNRLRIDVSSELGPGTEFRSYFSACEAARASDGAKGGREIQKLERGSEHALIAEDEAPIRTLVSETLSSLGYEVEQAQNAEDALRVFQKTRSPFDPFLTDVVLPGMTGRELAKELKNASPDMKVVYMTGYVDAHRALEGALRDSRAWLLRKPLTRAMLASKLQTALDI